MSRAVTMGYDSLDAADDALERVTSEVELADVAVLSNSPAGRMRLQNFTLPDEVRRSCEQALERSGFLFVALVADQEKADRVRALLASAPAAPEPAGDVQPEQAAPVVEEERIPLIEEQLRVGKRQVVRGGARVRTQVIETPVHEEVELMVEQTKVDRRPANRRVTEEEVAEAGLLKERVIEISEMREEAVVSKEAFVREELVVTKSVEQRIERVEETVRRTEATVEELGPDGRPALSGLDPDRKPPSP